MENTTQNIKKIYDETIHKLKNLLMEAREWQSKNDNLLHDFEKFQELHSLKKISSTCLSQIINSTLKSVEAENLVEELEQYLKESHELDSKAENIISCRNKVIRIKNGITFNKTQLINIDKLGNQIESCLFQE